ncbi:hypothetical protein JKF63_03846 [Porcisia hertigi]|uniref:Cytochrome b5 heme-binding domain-containing protein n=1 Tax=Porcisia hertigi TaxID=2761500 RepID=A0A836HR17_9TRYP|nr:hypothetical protein JKF63_03846 [Porcisia hertigi]
MPPTNGPSVRLSYKNNYYIVPLTFITGVHPGGERLILPYVNQDITQAFVDAKHSDHAVQVLEQWMEGTPAGQSRVTSPLFAAGNALPSGRGNGGHYAQMMWDAFVFGLTGASVMAAVLCRQLKQ